MNLDPFNLFLYTLFYSVIKGNIIHIFNVNCKTKVNVDHITSETNQIK